VIKINSAGWLYIVLTILIGFSAVNTGNNLIYILASALLSYMLVSGAFGRRNLMDLRIELEVPDEIFAGSEVPVGIRLINQRRFMPAFLIRVTIEKMHCLFSCVSAKSAAKQFCSIEFEHRGEYLIRDIHISSVFPFNFFTRARKLQHSRQLICFSKT
jgi:uncharacterized protein (DUF58 family)